MPQLSWFTDRLHAPTRFEVDYMFNPLHPEKDATCTITIKNGAGDAVDFVYFTVPGNVVHELMLDAIAAAWETYLFGEPGQLRNAVAAVVKVWRAEAQRRP